MKLKYSNDEHIFNIHTDGIPYLSFDMFDRLGVPNLFSTRYISYDEAAGTGVKGLRCAVMKTESVEEAAPVCRANRDILAHQLGSSLEMELVTDQKHTNYVHVATCEEDLGVATVGSFSLHRQFVDGIVTDIPDAILTVFGGDCPPVYLMDPEGNTRKDTAGRDSADDGEVRLRSRRHVRGDWPGSMRGLLRDGR